MVLNFTFLFQQKFVLRGGSVLNELPEVPDTNLLPFDENLDGGQQFDVEKIVVHPKFNPFTYEHDIALVRNIWFFFSHSLKTREKCITEGSCLLRLLGPGKSRIRQKSH